MEKQWSAYDRLKETTMWYSAIGCVVTLILMLLAVALAAAQPLAKVPRLGVLLSGSPPAPSSPSVPFIQRVPEFGQGLRDLGYVEGENITFAYRYAEGNLDRLPDLAAELVHLPVDMLLAAGIAGALAAKHATTTIPIVFFEATDPVGRGLVASLARPGGNITGVAYDGGPELFGKRLELLKAAVPTVSRVAMLSGQVRALTYDAGEQAQESAARALGLTLRYFYVRQREQFMEWVFPAIKADTHTIDALHVGGPLALQYRQQIADFALQHRLPTIGIIRDLAAAGHLLSYGPTRREMRQRTAVLVGKILQGATPADLPVEQPTKFELVINLKTAQELGLTKPPMLLFQADEVIQ
jgi:putative ABC transport system substrate-binding protein